MKAVLSVIKPGDIVKGAQFPETVEIKKVESIEGEYYSIAAIGRDTNQYYELLLELNDMSALICLSQQTEAKVNATTEDIQHMLQYYAFEVDERFSKGRPLGNTRLIPLPHQVEAVYNRMLQVPQVRYLLADDPGAGKTIMSGMVIKELKARASASRILILVPPLVLKQWQEELEEKFGEHFRIINRSTVSEYGGKNPFIENDLCLASMYWAARDDVKSYVSAAEFDFIIVDEAHKMAAYTHGTINKKTAKTKMYQLGELILRQSQHALLLTATPHKGDMENFRHLMRLIDYDIFSSTSINENLREKTNPFLIRRLKETMTTFEGTPLFPPRSTKTIQYQLSPEELELYDLVTNYVRYHFNRAINSGNNSTAFAMMLLQRRLTSSLEAIHLSLQRRKKRLIKLMEQTELERKRYLKKLKTYETEDYHEESFEVQDQMERALEQSIDSIDINELQLEIDEISKLVDQASYIKKNSVERKYEELELTLFGVEGLLNQGEKILIFTESVDTLNFLERKLSERVPKIAKIVGQYSIDERRRQVEVFRHECQIMLATDAGGESINLQFCNQMINYDIPWNPNRLEQRMGRIHRIGQKNEVAIFNLVASNTREGDVMIRLLEKMEQMREDLGTDLVYDFIGEVIENEYGDLASLMQAAVLNRENLDDIIATMDKSISEEHKKLIKLVEQEQLEKEIFDLPTLKKEHHDLSVHRLPVRCYSMFSEHIFKQNNVRVHKINEGKVNRVDRLPKFIRDFSRKNQLIQLVDMESMKYTGYQKFEELDVEVMNNNHPLFQLALKLSKKETEKWALNRFMVSYPVKEPLSIEAFLVTIADGTGQELRRELIFLVKRENGEVVQLDTYWLFQTAFDGEWMQLNDKSDQELRSEAVKVAIQLRNEIREKREKQLDKVAKYLHKTFTKQIDEVIEKREKYEQENIEHRNSALINQMNANLIDIEARRDERQTLIERQMNIGMKPPKRLFQIEIMPNGKGNRVFSIDFKEIVEKHENQNGRQYVKTFHPLALVDFYSERFNGEPRYILVSDKQDYFPSEDHLEDLHDILDKVYIYVVLNGQVVQERSMAEEIIVLK